MRFRFWTLLGVLVFVLSGCGGGGSGSGGSTVINRIAIDVPANQVATGNIGQARITIPTGTFGGPTSLPVTEQAAPKFAQPGDKTLQPTLNIEMPSAPVQAIQVEYPDTAQPGTLFVASLDGNSPVGAYEVKRQNGKIVVTISPEMFDRGRSPTIASRLVLGISTLFNSPDADFGLTRISLDLGTKNRPVVIVHGISQTADEMRPAVNRALTVGGYDASYSFRYDDRVPFAEAGAELARAIREGGFIDKSVDIIGYSKGGLVTRYALEVSGETKKVRRAIFLAVPNSGCNLSLTLFYGFYLSVFLTSPIGIPLVAIGDDSIAELLPTSAALASLNAYQHVQRGKVDYFFFASNGDDVVNANSALAQFAIGNMTNGAVYRETLSNSGHLAMDEPAVISEVYQRISGLESGLSLEVYPEPCEASSYYGNWRVDVTIGNGSSAALTIESVQFEEFDRYGDWQGNYWYNPDYLPGVFFPHQRHDWNSQLNPGQSKVLGIEYWPDESRTPVWNAPVRRKARTSNIIVLAHDSNGKRYDQKFVLHMTYNGISPAEPSTRAPRGESAPSSIAIRK